MIALRTLKKTSQSPTEVTSAKNLTTTDVYPSKHGASFTPPQPHSRKTHVLNQSLFARNTCVTGGPVHMLRIPDPPYVIHFSTAWITRVHSWRHVTDNPPSLPPNPTRPSQGFKNRVRLLTSDQQRVLRLPAILTFQSRLHFRADHPGTFHISKPAIVFDNPYILQSSNPPTSKAQGCQI